MPTTGGAQSSSGDPTALSGDVPLTESERAFLLAHTDMQPADLCDEGWDKAAREVATAVNAARREAEKLAKRGALSLDEVGRRLGVAPAQVHALVRDGELLCGFDRDGSAYFPPWQFTASGCTLPGLSEVLRALPEDYDVHATTTFMNTSNESFDGWTPVQWLTAGRDISTVVGYVSDLGWV